MPPTATGSAARGKLPSLEIVEEEAEFVRFIYRQYLAGDGAQSIARQLNAMGSSPHRGAQWSRSSVRHILSNPTFAGKVAWNRVKHFRPGEHGHDRHHVVYMPESEWLLVDGAHEPIIPFEQWEAAQQRRRARSVPPRRSGAAANPLAGLIVCARCGRKMQKSGEYLLCPTAGCCAAARFTCIAEALYSALEPSVPRLRLRPRAVDALPSPLSAVGALERELARVEAVCPGSTSSWRTAPTTAPPSSPAWRARRENSPLCGSAWTRPAAASRSPPPPPPMSPRPATCASWASASPPPSRTPS